MIHMSWLAFPTACVLQTALGDIALDVIPEAESTQHDVCLLQTHLHRGTGLTIDEGIKGEESMEIQERRVVFTLATLPYPYNALEPHIDTATMFYHHDKHHQAYIDNLNVAIKDRAPGGAPTLLQGAVSEADAIHNDAMTSWNVPLSDILREAKENDTAIRNNAGGAWNHYFFWLEMAVAGERGKPSSSFMTAINESFGSFEAFQDEFASAGSGCFGSGFAWLVLTNGTLGIIITPNQDNPLMSFVDAGIPIMGIDIWEHAYYLKYRNSRADYIDAWWNVVHWNQVNLWYSGAVQGQVPDVSMYLVNGALVKLDDMAAPDPPSGLVLYERKALDKRAHLSADVSAATVGSDAFYKLPRLPYAYDALEPHIDKLTMTLHHNEHQQAYIDKLNTAVSGYQAQDLEHLVQGSLSEVDVVRNNAAGAWNHGFFWLGMAPAGACGVPSSKLLAALNSSFGSFEALREEFKTAGAKSDGDSWLWLVVTNQTLRVMTTTNQNNPLMRGLTASPEIPILGLDISEHAYYLKNKDRRADYIDAWWKVVNWNRVNKWYTDAIIGHVPDINA